MIVKIEPVPKPRMTRSDRWKKRKCVVEYFLFKDQLRAAIPEHEVILPLSITFTIAMPKSWSGKKKLSMLGMPHRQKPDLDNLIKAVCDALYDDDSGLWQFGTMQKVWGIEGSIEFL